MQSAASLVKLAVLQVFHEAKRTAPSVIYMPYINELWGVVSDSLRVTFLTLVRSMNPSTPVLLLATSEAVYGDLDDQVRCSCHCCPNQVSDCLEKFVGEFRRTGVPFLFLLQSRKVRKRWYFWLQSLKVCGNFIKLANRSSTEGGFRKRNGRPNDG